MAQRKVNMGITTLTTAPLGRIGALVYDELDATDLPDTAVTPGVYTAADITVDAQGRITAAANGTGGSSGTVTSVDVSGGTTGLTTSGGPVTTSGTITLGGTLAVANGGTGETTAPNAINALLPSQTGNSGKVLSTNGTVASWTTPTTAPVTSVNSLTGAVVLTTANVAESGNLYFTNTRADARVQLGFDNFFWKRVVAVATTVNRNFATDFADGQVVDGVTLTATNRILIKNQTTLGENGIYVVNASGPPTIATDQDGSLPDDYLGMVYVRTGTVNAGTIWKIDLNAASLATMFVQTYPVSLANNSVTNAVLRDSAALSVVGRSANSAGDPADITAGTDNHVLRQSGSVLGFGLLTLNSLTMNTGKLLGRTTASTGAPEELTVSAPLSLSGGALSVAAAGCRVYASGSQTIATSTLTALGYNSEAYDTNGLHDTVTNNTRVTIPAGMGGKWLLTVAVQLSAGTAGNNRQTLIYKNGTTIVVRDLRPASALAVNFALSVVDTFAAGDYLEVFVYHDQGASLTTSGGAEYAFAATYLGS